MALILFGHEESQACTIAFRELGHEAYSNDLKPCSGGHPEWHLQMDVMKAARLKKWDAAVFFPDCTYIIVSGHWQFALQLQIRFENPLLFVQHLGRI